MTDSATVELRGENKQLRTALDNSEGLFKSFGTKVKAAIGAVGAALLVNKIAGWGRAWIESAFEAQKAVNQLKAALDANDVGLTVEQVAALGDEMQNLTKYTGDQIKANARLIAGFGNIKGDVFKEAIKSAADLAAFSGKQLPEVMRLVGKSLSDPVSAISGLREAGIAFTKEQERLITGFVEMNDVASAQKVILQQLRDTVGGQAAAEVEDAAGRWERFKNHLDDVGKSIGEAVIPVLDELSPVLESAVEWIKAGSLVIVDGIKIAIEWGKAIYDWVLTPWKKAQEGVVVAVTVIQTVLENWRDVTIAAFETVLLVGTKTFLDLKHFLTEVMPAAAEWFLSNWKDILNDYVEFTKTVIMNIFTNFKSLFDAIVSYLSGGDFDLTWTPLLDGFKRTTEQFPEIAARAKTALESALEVDIANRTEDIAKKFKENLQANMIAAFGDESVQAAAEAANDETDLSLDPNAANEARARGKARGDKTGRQAAIEDLVALNRRITQAAASQRSPEDKVVDAQKEGSDKIVNKTDEVKQKVEKGNEELAQIKAEVKKDRQAVFA